MTDTPNTRDAAHAIPDTGMEEIRLALVEHTERLYEALGWPVDLDPDDAATRAAELRAERDQACADRDDAHATADEYYALAETAAAQRAALWHLLRKQTRAVRTWRRRANEAIAEAVEQTARDMKRSARLRAELDDARAELKRLRAQLTEPVTDTTAEES